MCSLPASIARTWVTYQVTKFYSGHGCLKNGPETPKEMRCQGIPKGQEKRSEHTQRCLNPATRMAEPQGSDFSCHPNPPCPDSSPSQTVLHQPQTSSSLPGPNLH